MAQITFKTQINAPQSQVWNALADLGAIQNFNPAVKKSYYTSDEKEGIGAARICELAPVGIIKETAIDWQPGESYTVEIEPVEKMPPLKNVKAQISLNALSPNLTEASMVMDYEAKNVVGSLMMPILKKGFTKSVQGVIKGLKAHIESGGREVKDFKSLEALQAQLILV